MPVFLPAYSVPGLSRSEGLILALHVHCLGDGDSVLSETAALERAASWTAKGHGHEGFQIFGTAGALH